MPKIQIGLFGGTFDPPHIVHLILASEATYQFNLSRLLWVLTPDPPHKQEQVITPVEDRMEMLQYTIANNPAFELSRIELDRAGPHYTADTVRLFAQQEPDAEITLLIGGDSLRDLPAWHQNVDLIAAVHKIGVMRRPGNSLDLSDLEAQLPGVTKKVKYIDTLLQNLSSREIRRRIKDGEPFRYYIHPQVFDYIESNDLYR